jgi:hypothetical protein
MFVQLLLLWESNYYYIFWVRVCSLGIQHAMCMRHIVICGLQRSTIFLPHYLINGKIFEKKVTEYNMRVSIFSTTFV